MNIKTIPLIAMGWLLAVPLWAAIPTLDDFDSYASGTSVNTLLNWGASASAVQITNGAANSSSNSVILPERQSASNYVDGAGATTVWSDYYVRPVLGLPPGAPPTNTASYCQYFDTNGYVVAYTRTGTQVCSNDIWGASVAAVTSNDWVHISVYQNYASSNSALLVNGRLVLQDFPFVASRPSYGYLKFNNPSRNAWIDDLWVKTNYNPVLTVDSNGVYGADAQELQLYGYAARTFYVGPSRTYTTLAAALAVARDRDTLYVDCGPYGENVTVTQNLTLAGCTFTNNTGFTMTVAAGNTLTTLAGFQSDLNVLGVLTVGAGIAVSGTTVAVGTAGRIDLGPNATAQLLAGNLGITSGGQVVSAGGHVVTDGVDLTGTFTLDGNWGSTTFAHNLTPFTPFVETFESYGNGSRIQNLGHRAWGANSTNAVVKAGQGHASVNAAMLPNGTVISNRITTVQTNIWTDCYLKPSLGIAPRGTPASAASFLGYVATNGYFVVATTSGWVTCTADITNGPLPAMSASGYTRVTVHENFTTRRFALFVGGLLVRELEGFPGPPTTYRSLKLNNADGSAYADGVTIATALTALPAGLTQDSDADEMPDANEIDRYGSIRVRDYWSTTTLFRFR